MESKDYIEHAIEEILRLGEDVKAKLFDEGGNEHKGESRRGRPAVGNIPIWAIEDGGASKRRTLALISMCIKEDFKQSLPSLAKKVSSMKRRPYGESLAVLRELRKKGELGYYDEEFRLIRWKPGEIASASADASI